MTTLSAEEIAALSEKWAHIPTAEIKADIAEAKSDVERWMEEIKAYEILGDHMSMFRVLAARDRIHVENNRIPILEAVVAYRESQEGTA